MFCHLSWNAIPTFIRETYSFPLLITTVHVSAEPSVTAPKGNDLSRRVPMLAVCRAGCVTLAAGKPSRIWVTGGSLCSAKLPQSHGSTGSVCVVATFGDLDEGL